MRFIFVVAQAATMLIVLWGLRLVLLDKLKRIRSRDPRLQKYIEMHARGGLADSPDAVWTLYDRGVRLVIWLVWAMMVFVVGFGIAICLRDR